MGSGPNRGQSPEEWEEILYIHPSVHPSFLLSICPKESESQREGYNGLLEGSEGMPDGSEGLPEGSEGLPEGSEGLPEGSKGFLEGPARRVSGPIRGPAWGDRQMYIRHHGQRL